MNWAHHWWLWMRTAVPGQRPTPWVYDSGWVWEDNAVKYAEAWVKYLDSRAEYLVLPAGEHPDAARGTGHHTTDPWRETGGEGG